MLNVSARRSILFALVGLTACATIAVSCTEPTEIRLNLRTDLACEELEIAVAVGAPGDALETKERSASGFKCSSSGEIGSVTIVPSGSKSDEIGIRVLAGPLGDIAQCAKDNYAHCIVARRTLRYTPHKSIVVDIPLIGNCRGVICDSSHTCNAYGECIDAHELDAGTYSSDAGTYDAGTGDATTTDAGLDASDAADAPADASTDAATDAAADAEPTVQCGSSGLRCPMHGNECCLTIDIDAQTVSGECLPGSACSPATKAFLECDDESDCAAYADDAGHPGICFISGEHADDPAHTPLTVTGSRCINYFTYSVVESQYGYELCQHRESCFNGNFLCVPSQAAPDAGNALPGYAWCRLPYAK